MKTGRTSNYMCLNVLSFLVFFSRFTHFSFSVAPCYELKFTRLLVKREIGDVNAARALEHLQHALVF